MELWRELIDLEHSNMTRSGEWLDLGVVSRNPRNFRHRRITRSQG